MFPNVSSGQVGASYMPVTGARSVLASENGMFLRNATASNYAITIDAGMVDGFGFVYIQASTGLASIVAGAGVTLVGSTLTTAAKGDIISIVWLATNEYAVYVSSVS